MRQVSKMIVGIVAGFWLHSSSSLGAELLVGVELPITGTLARVGSGMQEGIQVAADVFNKSNGKHTVKIITADNESTPAKSVAAVEKLASQGVQAITGGYGSNNIGPASDAANKLKLPYVTSGGVDDNLTERGYKTFFRINNTVGYQKAVLGLIDEMKLKSISIVFSTKEATSDLAHDIQRSLSSKGFRVGMHAFDPAIADFKPVINKIRLQDRPEAILMVGYENDYVGILRASKVLKPDVKAIIGVWSLATPKMAADFPELMPSVFGTALMPFPAEFHSKEGKVFSDTYRKLYNKEPDYLGQFGYVQATILFDAMARAADKGTLKKGGVIEELANTDRETLIGHVKFNDKGDNVKFVHRVGQHQSGRIEIVWPREIATAKMNFPSVPW